MSSGVVNSVMTIIGFVFSSLFIVFVCTRLVFARILLASRRSSFPMTTDISMMERGSHGLEPLALSYFPTKRYSHEFFKYPQCAVCLADYHEEDMLRILTFCGHSFHVNCIDIWLHQHSTCPICRMSMRENVDKKHLMKPIFSSAIRSADHAGESHSLQCFTDQVVTTNSAGDNELCKSSISTSVQ